MGKHILQRHMQLQLELLKPVQCSQHQGMHMQMEARSKGSTGPLGCKDLLCSWMSGLCLLFFLSFAGGVYAKMVALRFGSAATV